mmetsp:Transcript_21082/g.45939  ORF Transcript_21082/g.45939 Transcript_21082/m.45939 type:complete len:81 (+) Transcript_21082:72-314(+)
MAKWIQDLKESPPSNGMRNAQVTEIPDYVVWSCDEFVLAKAPVLKAIIPSKMRNMPSVTHVIAALTRALAQNTAQNRAAM